MRATRWARRLPFAGVVLDLRARRAHDRELGRDEQRVGQDQQRDDRERDQDDAHRASPSSGATRVASTDSSARSATRSTWN